MARGKTIQIYLTDGEPSGIRTAELTTSITKAVVVPRRRLNEAAQRDELSQAGLYFLFESQGVGEESRVYVGQSLNCLKRLREHNKDGKKDYWNLAVAFITKDNSYTPTHLSFLEQMAISLANEAKRYAVENAVTPSKFAISEALESECEDHFDAILLLLGTLGLPVFKPLHAKESAQQNLDQVFWAKARGSSARGMMVDEGFVLLAGSQGPSSVTQSFSQRQRELRDKLVEQGTATTENGCYEIVQDLLLGSPSAASDIILGRSSNGWTEWKDDRGRTLDEVYRKTN